MEKVAITPSLTPEARQAIEAAGYMPQSLEDLVEGHEDMSGLMPSSRCGRDQIKAGKAWR